MKSFALVAVLAACNNTADAPRAAKLELIEAPAVPDARPLVISELATAARGGKRLLVYVGAEWCEPCRYFHDAAVAGQLDATFGSLRVLAFDADRDREALKAGGYKSELIPLFALPNADGTASGKQIEGSIKGAGAVAQITPRLQQLLQ